MFGRMTQEERDQAISYLIEQSSEEILHTVYNESQEEMWWVEHHFGIGIWVRNRLRERFTWGSITLDDEWAGLIAEAARRYIEGEE